MNRTFGHARYVDELERVLYNGILCGVSLAGDKYTYINPLVADESKERWSWHDCPCCPPMFLKMMGTLPSLIYATDSNSAYVNLFVGGRASMKVKGVDLAIRQATRYPWEGHVRLELHPSTELKCALMVRIPSWCKGPKLAVNAKPVAAISTVRGYARLERTWRKGDVVELEMPMPVELIRGDPKVEANVGRVAIRRGPLIYCLESIDGNDLKALRIGGADALTSEHRLDLDVVAIRGKSLTAIPFYANGNRGPVQMAVWIPTED
jgi:DUF1680 family protein